MTTQKASRPSSPGKWYLTYFSEYIIGGKLDKHISGPHSFRRCEQIRTNLSHLGYCFDFMIVPEKVVINSGLWFRRNK